MCFGLLSCLGDCLWCLSRVIKVLCRVLEVTQSVFCVILCVVWLLIVFVLIFMRLFDVDLGRTARRKCSSEKIEGEWGQRY